MEPEVHIIEKYFQIVLGCLTMANVKCKGNKEIDLLAMNPRTQERFHVEARIATKHKIRESNGMFYYWKQSRESMPRTGLDYFQRHKFEDKRIKEKIAEIFGENPYRKILVVWGVEGDSVFSTAKEKYGFELLFLGQLIADLLNKDISGSRDDILRLTELFSLYLKDRYKEEA